MPVETTRQTSKGFGRSYSPILQVIEVNKMRETGWSPIYCRRRILRRVVPSKKLLLQGEIPDDNMAYNGEV